MNNLKAFLEADALRTQGEWKSFGCDVSGKHFDIYDEGGHSKENANFIAAASRIAPEIRAMQEELGRLAIDSDVWQSASNARDKIIEQMQAALEQVCEALEALRDDIWDDKVCDDALVAAAPYRKGGV